MAQQLPDEATSAGLVDSLTYAPHGQLIRDNSFQDGDRKDEKSLEDAEVQKAREDLPQASRFTSIPWKYRILALICACTFPMGRNCGRQSD